MTTPAGPTVEIGTSPGRTLGLTLLSALMTAASAALALVGEGVVVVVVGWVGALFFGACGAVWVRRALVQRGAVVTVSPEGFRDVRIARETVPWADVLEISTWTHSGQHVLVLRVADDVWDRLTLTTIARSSRRANRALGADGLAVTAQGLRTTYPELFRLTVEAASAAWQSGGGTGVAGR
ncbi:STM3941 family protein [Cellulomonas sp. NS3]|uniref:STM3941 family protein n=1 Tax=Cellulomonas sp. NS3 TaxID=2973977 RepID=UPI002161B49D|nr:STM3941 family protein [Cellulomonas sp. NS3]